MRLDFDFDDVDVKYEWLLVISISEMALKVQT